VTKNDGNRKILLAANDDETSDNQSQTNKAPAKSAVDINLNEIKIRAKRFHDVGPLPGLGLTKEEVPGNIQSITAQQIKESHSLSMSDLMNSQLQSVNVNDYQGNPFQMDVTYRGFTASPQIGTSQGLSVFFDGIRVNEPFGDVVNWDLIPMNALAGMDVFPGSNPLFGLNTLGGALAVKTKSGFDFKGVNAEILSGSFGRKQLQASGGWNDNSLAAFGAVNLFLEDGWRKNSPSKVNQAFGKLEWRNDNTSLAFSSLVASNKLVGNGTVPAEMFAQDPRSIFTSPDETRNKLLQFQLSGEHFINDNFSVTGQVYRRNSNRRSFTGDMIDEETFGSSGFATRKAAPGENITCAFKASPQGIPEYYVDRLDQDDGNGGFTSAFYSKLNSGGGMDYSLLNSNTLNQTLDPNYVALIKMQLAISSDPSKNYPAPEWPYDPNTFETLQTYEAPAPLTGGTNNYFYDVDGYKNLLVELPPLNASTCMSDSIHMNGGGTKLYINDANGNVIFISRDGAAGTAGNTGYVDGTPTAIITKAKIDQTTDGASVQFNWNLDKHKIMLGASIDASGAEYDGKQRLAMLDNNRFVRSDPLNIGEEYAAAQQDIDVNAFDGSENTRSLYFNETWSPIDTFHVSFAGRYNHTRVKNKLATLRRSGQRTLTEYLNQWPEYVVCTDLDSCAIPLDKPNFVDYNNKTLYAPETEKFKYHSFNPSIGATWQATPRVNVYGNLNQGTRVPSVVELGCAFDDTPTQAGYRWNPITHVNEPIYKPRSLALGNACTLPSTMSGDPYLPQVRAQTIEIGGRGQLGSLLDWNVSAYRTNVYHDIYMVGYTPELSFFQDVGQTRRQGIEFGLSGDYGKSDFKINYSLSEATFQSSFKMLSANNSSRELTGLSANMIQVEPGDRLPGIPLNNLNASFGYKLTSKWKVRLNMVAHGGSFVRGNENNDHTPGPGRMYVKRLWNPQTSTWENVMVKEPDYKSSGKSPGFATFNLSTSYDFGSGWTMGAVVNNLFDKQYFSAGRLGLNPFAPSVHGAIGAGGFNYNSSEWLGTQFVSGAAPRGIWVTLGYDFDSDKEAARQKQFAERSAPALDNLPPPERPADVNPALQLALNSNLTLSGNDGKNRFVSESEKGVRATLESLKTAQISLDGDGYLRHYAANFKPADGSNHRDWEIKTKNRINAANRPTVTVSDLSVASKGQEMSAMFTETSQSGRQKESVRRVLEFKKQDGRWLIIREFAFPARTNIEQTKAEKQSADLG
ncbi:MAG: TonB-dependent receptor, partial [Methylotenera sp.]|uniref:TonB-dependent receptor domain-containing protein n=1 Tax=Methylotenera sp. TaxID=2051956 RepID=UPI00182D693D